MTRRDLITLFGNTAIAWPLAARAQQPANLPTVGWLVFEAGEGALDGFRRDLRELGHLDGQNIAIEARHRADGLIVDSDPINGTNRERIVAFAAANRLAAI